jgi:hypothetical protein
MYNIFDILKTDPPFLIFWKCHNKTYIKKVPFPNKEERHFPTVGKITQNLPKIIKKWQIFVPQKIPL